MAQGEPPPCLEEWRRAVANHAVGAEAIKRLRLVENPSRPARHWVECNDLRKKTLRQKSGMMTKKKQAQTE
jgi:uncharacterized protein (DUF427 family)